MITYVECGKYPPSVFCQTDVLCYLHRLLTMPDGKLVKSVFCTLNALHSQGFPTWVTKAYDLAQTYNIDMDGSTTLSPKHFKSLVSELVKSNFITNWYTDLHEKPLLRSYRLYIRKFTPECYLDYITLPRYCNHYLRSEPVHMTLQSNADGIRHQKLTQTKGFVRTALKLKMKNISWQTVKLMHKS